MWIARLHRPLPGYRVRLINHFYNNYSRVICLWPRTIVSIYLVSNWAYINICNEIFLQDFVVILKRPLQYYYKILKKCFLCTTWTMMLSRDSNIYSHTGVLFVTKGLIRLPLHVKWLPLAYMHHDHKIKSDRWWFVN